MRITGVAIGECGIFRRIEMNKLFAGLFVAAALAPSLALAADYPLPAGGHAVRGPSSYGLPYPLSLEHNYGPGQEPGSFAYYDGPATNRCYHSAAGYLGQDGRRHPCF